MHRLPRMKNKVMAALVRYDSYTGNKFPGLEKSCTQGICSARNKFPWEKLTAEQNQRGTNSSYTGKKSLAATGKLLLSKVFRPENLY